MKAEVEKTEEEYKISKLRRLCLWFWVDTWIGDFLWIIFVFIPETLIQMVTGEESHESAVLYMWVIFLAGVLIGLIF